MKPVFLVDIGGDPVLLLIVGVFVVTFLTVCAVAYVMLAKRDTNGQSTTWKFQLRSRVPVSRPTFERIAHGTAAALARPQITESTRARLNQLERARGVFVSVYRVLFISLGLAGLIGGMLLLKSHTPANMFGLPGGIIVLLSLGALLKGIVPGPSVAPMEPLDQAHLDLLREKIKVHVSTSEPLRVTLSAPQVRAAGELLGRGVPIADAVRAVYPEYEALSELDKRALEFALEQAAQES